MRRERGSGRRVMPGSRAVRRVLVAGLLACTVAPAASARTFIPRGSDARAAVYAILEDRGHRPPEYATRADPQCRRLSSHRFRCEFVSSGLGVVYRGTGTVRFNAPANHAHYDFRVRRSLSACLRHCVSHLHWRGNL